MKIFDCFQFFDEEMLLDLRLNILDKYVDKFVITEANYMHSGKSKKHSDDETSRLVSAEAELQMAKTMDFVLSFCSRG